MQSLDCMINMKYTKFLLTLFILFLSACQPANPPELVVQTLQAHSTSTPHPPTATLTPTQTIAPTPTATATELPFSWEEFPQEQLSIGDPYSPELGNLGYDVQEYFLQINIDPSEPYYIEGIALITAISDFPVLEYVSLDFAGFTVHNIEVNDDDVQFLRTEYKLLIKLNEPLSLNEEFQIFVHYSGQPDDSQTAYSFIKFSQGAVFPSNRTMIAISEPDGARKIFPCNDHPRDKALFKIDLITPADLIGVSNGNLVDIQELLDTNEIKYSWLSNDLMATYLLTLAVGDFTIKEYEFDNGLIVRNYVLPGTAYSLGSYMPILNDAMDYFEDLFGPYPFETYGHVLHLLNGVTLETQATVALASGMVDENTLVHELIHMWFGNWVSLDSWGEIWRNEGFATYFGKLWVYRNRPNYYRIYLESAYSNAVARDDLYSLGGLPQNEMFGFESYVVGSLLVFKLREELGDEAFFDGLKDYFILYGGESASDDDFQDVMEDACQCSLEVFFDFWLEP